MFKITFRGKIYKFASLEIAKEAARRVFELTGIVVGIEHI